MGYFLETRFKLVKKELYSGSNIKQSILGFTRRQNYIQYFLSEGNKTVSFQILL